MDPSIASVAGDLEVFPALAGDVHLNHAGVAPLPRPVADAIRAYLDDWSRHGPQPWAYQRIGSLRGLAARAIGAASAGEIAIVANTSTGLATVAAGLELGPGDAIVTTAVEFPANRYVWDDRRARGAELSVVEPDHGTGRFVSDDAIEKAVRERFPRASGTKLLALSHVQYATGHEHDIARLAEVAHGLGGLICVDGIQSVGQMPLEVERWDIDFLSADGHKWLLGPEGCGILYVRRERFERLRPPLVGWCNVANALDYDRHDFRWAESARRYEPGCASLAGVVGLCAGLELLLGEGLERVQARVRVLAGELAEGARRAGLAVVSRHGPEEGNGIVAIDAGTPEAAAELHASLRSAGVHGAVRRGLLRLSPHFYNTQEQMRRVAAACAAERSPE